jgi:voltage-gated potassium channel
MKRRTFLAITYFLIILIIYSEIFVILKLYYENEYYSIFDGIYWVITTVTTVGYGDIVLHSVPGRIFTILVMLTGIFFLFGFLFPYVLIPWAEMRLRLYVPRKIEGLRNHVVVFGYNPLSRGICKELERSGIKFLVVESNEDDAKKSLEEGFPTILMDGTFIENVEGALSIVVAWKSPEKILDTLISLKNMNIDKYVVADDPFYAKYFLYAGAKKILMPKSIAGIHLARIILESVEGELDLKEVAGGIYYSEFIVGKGSKAEGKRIGEVERISGAKILAVCSDGKLYPNPSEDQVIEDGMILLAAGSRDELSSVFSMTRWRK